MPPFRRRSLFPLQPVRVALLLSLAATGSAVAQDADRPAGFDLVVAQDGSGDHTTVQAAVDAARAFPYGRVSIFVKDGVYSERVVVPSWNQRVTLVGESVERTILTHGAHFDAVARGRNSTFYTATLQVSGDDFHAQNLTVVNSAGPIGQALAIYVDADRAVFENCRFVGHQDTIYAAGDGHRQYFRDCYVEGTTDFIFGGATAVFEGCHLHAKADSYITAASTPEGVPFGFVFLNCLVTAQPGVEGVYLGRPWRDHAKTVFLRSTLDLPVARAGWHNWSRPETEATVLYAEYANTGRGADRSGRVGWSRELTGGEAVHYAPAEIFASVAPSWETDAEWFRRAVPAP